MNVTNKEILKPKIIGIESKETEKLFQTIGNDRTANATIQCLTELLERQEKQMQELKQELSQTKQKIKKVDTNNSNYMKHIDGEWKRFYLKDEIIDKPIVEFTALQLKEWARNKIITEKMTKKQYYNMAIIIRQSLDYLVERGELSVNHYNEFKVNTSLFTPVIPKEPEYEVFSEQ